MSTLATPPQPPKESTYTQPSNPVDQTPAEEEQQKKHEQQQDQDQDKMDQGKGKRPGTDLRSTLGPRALGDAIPAIRRTPDSRPSTGPEARVYRQRERERKLDLGGRDVDTEYGVEQQPAEGDIAAAVEGTSRRQRAQDGAHAGPVGSPYGPGAPANTERDFAADLGRKREEHDRVLGERSGKSPPAPEDEEQGQGQDRGVEAERKS